MSALENNTKYRIKRNSKYAGLMRFLIDDKKVFGSYSEVLTFSAIVGFLNDAYLPMQKEDISSDGVQMQFFTDTEQDFMNLIAYEKFGQQKILSTDEKFEIYESFANGGFPILLEILGIDPEDPNFDTKTIILNIANKLISHNNEEGFKLNIYE